MVNFGQFWGEITAQPIGEALHPTVQWKTRALLREEAARDLAKELSKLSRLQYEALQKSFYLRMTSQGASEYDTRRVRISEICSALAEIHPKRR